MNSPERTPTNLGQNSIFAINLFLFLINHNYYTQMKNYNEIIVRNIYNNVFIFMSMVMSMSMSKYVLDNYLIWIIMS